MMTATFLPIIPMRILAKICDFVDSTRRREDMTFLALMILFPISMFGSVKPEVAALHWKNMEMLIQYMLYYLHSNIFCHGHDEEIT